jgi:hypothetical protein
MRSKTLAAVAATALALILAACGGGSGTVTPATPVTTTISGSAVKGPVSGATVTVKNAATGAVLGTTTTGPGGAYTLDVQFTGDVIVEVSGGTYTDEATGASTALATPLRVVLNANGGNVTGIVTPLTTMAYTQAFQGGTAVTTSAFDARAQSLASQFGLSGVNLATTLPQVTGTTNAYGDSLRALSRYMADNGKTLATVTNAVFANAGDLSTFNTLYNDALARSGSSMRVTFTANGFNISGSGAGGGTGTCGVNVQGTITANGFTVPLDLNYCIAGIAAGSCTRGNASLSQALNSQQGVVGAANLAYTYAAACAAGAFTITLQ